MKSLYWITYILMFIGAINWALIAFFNFDLAASIFGVDTLATTIVYALYGIAAIVNLLLLSTSVSCDTTRYEVPGTPY